MKSLYKNEQSGRSMVEMLGVLAIIGVLSIGGISGYSKAMAKYRVNKTLDQISILVMNIRSLFSASYTYEGLTEAVAIQMGIIPGDMQDKNDTGKIINAYQGGVFLATGSSGGADRSFIVQYAGLTQEACVAIATADWGSQAGSGLVSIKVGPGKDGDKRTKVDAFTSTFEVDDMPVAISAAANACSATNDDTGNVVQWEYY